MGVSARRCAERVVSVPSHSRGTGRSSCGWALDCSPREEEGMAGVSSECGGFSLYSVGSGAGKGLGLGFYYFFLNGAG